MTPRRIHEFICLLRLRSPLAFLMARLQLSEKDVFFGQSRFWHCDLARLSMPSSADRRGSFYGQSRRGERLPGAFQVARTTNAEARSSRKFRERVSASRRRWRGFKPDRRKSYARG
jgi:hypothetical protein